MKIELLESAVGDLRRGKAFYERQGKGLGEYFVSALSSDIDSLRLYAGLHPVRFDDFYRCLSRRFPFAVYYRVEGHTVRVYAVADCRQDPHRLERRLVARGRPRGRPSKRL